MRLNLTEMPRLRGRSDPFAADAPPSADHRREELLRRIRGEARPATDRLGAPAADVGTRRAPAPSDRPLGDLLARGVGRTITADGLEWLLHRNDVSELAPLTVVQPTLVPVLVDPAVDPVAPAIDLVALAVDPVGPDLVSGGTSTAVTPTDRESSGKGRRRRSAGYAAGSLQTRPG